MKKNIKYEDNHGNSVCYGDLDETIAIIQSNNPDCSISDDWDGLGEQNFRRLVWASEGDSINDCGGNAIGQIVMIDPQRN